MFKWWLGPLMDAAGDGGGGGGVAVADAASDFGGDSGSSEASGEPSSDSQVHDAEFVDPSQGEPATPQPGTALVKSGERAVVNGKFTGSGKAVIEALKPLGGQVAQQVTQALLTRDYFMKEFPGGKREVQELRQLAQKHGGQEGISRAQEMASELERIDTLYESSDPAFIEQITQTPEGQRGFVGLIPQMFAKAEKLAPQQYGYQVAQGFNKLIETGGVPTLVATTSTFLDLANNAVKSGNHELASSFLAQIVNGYNSIVEVLSAIRTKALQAPPVAGSPSDPAIDTRTQQLNQREQQLQKQEWGTAVSNFRKATFSKAWANVTKGRTLTNDQEVNVKGFYELRMSAKERNWQNQSTRFFQNGDRDGYLKEQNAFFAKAIPEALTQAIQQALPGKPGPKATIPGGVTRPPVNGVRPPANAARVAKMPSSNEIDWNKQREGMISQRQAYLKPDGRLVTWA